MGVQLKEFLLLWVCMLLFILDFHNRQFRDNFVWQAKKYETARDELEICPSEISEYISVWMSVLFSHKLRGRLHGLYAVGAWIFIIFRQILYILSSMITRMISTYVVIFLLAINPIPFSFSTGLYIKENVILDFSCLFLFYVFESDPSCSLICMSSYHIDLMLSFVDCLSFPDPAFFF